MRTKKISYKTFRFCVTCNTFSASLIKIMGLRCRCGSGNWCSITCYTAAVKFSDEICNDCDVKFQCWTNVAPNTGERKINGYDDVGTNTGA